MKYEGMLYESRSVGELDNHIRGLSADGFRIINVLDRSSAHNDRFLIVAQKDVDAHIHVSGDRYEARPRFAPEPRLPRDRDPSKNP